MRSTSVAVVASALLLLGTACGGDDEPVVSGGPGPGAATDVVVSVTTGGGFVPFGTDFASVPTLVQRDGTVFTGGAITLQFPGPPVMPVLTGSLDAGDLRALLRAAEEAGLATEELDAGQPGVSDLPTTTVTVELDGETFTHEVYGLGFDAGAGPPDGDQPAPEGLTDEQRQVRRAVQGFVDEVSNRASETTTDQYEPTAYQVLALEVDPAQLLDQEPAPNELDWPFTDRVLPPADGGCHELEGEEAAVFADLLDEATQITLWRTPDGRAHQLSVRATLPGHDTC